MVKSSFEYTTKKKNVLLFNKTVFLKHAYLIYWTLCQVSLSARALTPSIDKNGKMCMQAVRYLRSKRFLLRIDIFFSYLTNDDNNCRPCQILRSNSFPPSDIILRCDPRDRVFNLNLKFCDYNRRIELIRLVSFCFFILYAREIRWLH